MQEFIFNVDAEYKGIRIDKFLAKKFSNIKPEITRSKIQKIIDDNLVFDSNGRTFGACSQKIINETSIIVKFEERASHDIKGKKIDFGIIYEDDDLVLINKPFGLTVHPGAGNNEDTLVNALIYKYQSNLSRIGGLERLGIVHRLDKDTSGLMLIAKNDFSHNFLSKKIHDREVKRIYRAFIYGSIDPLSGRIEKNIARCKTNRLKMTVTRSLNSRAAITHYKTIKTYSEGFASLLECSLETGRTHQIRVHLESCKHSIIGDKIYNSCKKNIPIFLHEENKNFISRFQRQALQSYKISFQHPRRNEILDFEIPLDEDLKNLEMALENKIVIL